MAERYSKEIMESVLKGKVTESKGNSTTTVQSGDTLSKIASDNGVSLDDLLAANPEITNPNAISVGQEVNIPGSGDSTVTANLRTVPDNVTVRSVGDTSSNGSSPISVQGSLSPGTSSTTHSAQSYNLSDEDYRKLCALVYSEAVEANSYAYSDSMAVTSTVLNRMESGNYGGNTVTGVISAQSQFSGYQNSKYNAAYNDPSIISSEMKQAIDDTLSGQRNVDTYSFYGSGTYNSFY